MLWAVLDRFEATREAYNWNALHSAMRRVWRARWPDVLLLDASDETDADEESDAELDENFDEKPDEEPGEEPDECPDDEPDEE